jgi:MraZ protein
VAPTSGTGGAGDGDGAAPRAAAAFRGVTELVLDAKGRVAIPTRYRDALAAGGDLRLVLTADPSRG